MKLTKISQQVSHPDRYAIYVDGRYSFSLSGTALLNQKLASGQIIDDQQLKTLKKLSVDDKVYYYALRFAAMRPRSQWELQTYLQRKNVTGPETEVILNKLSQAGLLDDEAFARSWLENRQLLKPSSTRRLVQELRQKHVEEQTIQKTLAGSQIDNQTTIVQVIIKKRRLAKYRQDELKLMQYLTRQGFNYADIKAALASKASKS